MNDAIIHPVPSDTSIVEEARDFKESIQSFFHNNRSAVNSAIVLGVSLVLQRYIMRRELRRIHFNIEVWDNGPGDHGDQRYLDDVMSE